MLAPLNKATSEDSCRRKSLQISANANAIFVFCKQRPECAPVIIGTFRVLDFQVSEGRLYWQATDIYGNNHESASWIDLGGVRMRPAEPYELWPTAWGTRTVFEIQMPRGHRVHHLSYFRRTYPGLALRTPLK